MKKRMRKMMLSLLAATTILASSGPVLANGIEVTMPTTIYETVNSENIASGVVHEHIQRFTNDGWWNVNITRVDLTNSYVEIKGLVNPDGIPKRSTVSNLVDTYNAVAAVNADYFDYQPVPSSLGPLINDGNLISSSTNLPTFFIDNNNKAGITYLDNKMAVINNTKGTQAIISTINKVDNFFSEVKLLNKHWGEKSMGNTYRQDLTEILVVDDQVVDKRIIGEPITIPTTGNAYVLSVSTNLLDSFEVGDQVSLQISTTPDINDIKFAIGGGSVVLNNGQITVTDIISKGNGPRTGIGINSDNTEIVLVTVDGRGTSFKGVTQEMLGAILRELGAYNGMNLDGGGSTTMAIKPKSEEKARVVNIPSEGSQRSIVNSLGVFSNAPVGELSYIKINTEEPKMFVNTSRYFNVKGYDENHNPVALNETLINLSSSGIEGELEGNRFKATSSGNGKIIAKYNDLISQIDVEVLGPVVDLETNVKQINIDTNSQRSLGQFYGKDKNGTKAKIYLNDIVFNIMGNIGQIKDGVFYSIDEPTGGAISAYAGNGVENILVSIGSQSQFVNGFESLEGLNLTTYPNTVTGNISLSEDKHEGNYSISLNYDFTQSTNTRAAYMNFSENGQPGISLAEKPQKIGLWVKGDENGVWLRTTIRDAGGKEHVLNFINSLSSSQWQYVTADIPKEVSYPISLEKIYAVEADPNKTPSGSILIDELTAYYPTPIGNIELPTPTIVEDELKSKQSIEENGFSFIVAAEPKGLEETAGSNAVKKLQSRISDNKIAILLNGASINFKNGLNNYSTVDTMNAYNVSKYMDALFYSINSSNGSIRAADASQWTKLMNDLENRTETNFILFLSTPVFGANGFKDTLEADLLHSRLVEAKERGKNIFVVYGGNNTNTDLIDGIRYISLNTTQITNDSDVSNVAVVEFVVNGSEISYEVNKVY